MTTTRESRPDPKIEAAPEMRVAAHPQDTETAPGAHLPGYCLLVTTPAERTTRRLFLSLHAATKAAERAERRGGAASLELCHIVPAGEVDRDA